MKKVLINRILAYAIDNIILASFFTFTHYLFFGTYFRHISSIDIGFATHPICIAFAFLYFLYFILLEGIKGKTIGKYIFQIKAQSEDGKECNIKKSIIRNLFRLVDGIGFYLIGIISIIISDKNQRIGDKFAKTVVKKNNYKK